MAFEVLVLSACTGSQNRELVKLSSVYLRGKNDILICLHSSASHLWPHLLHPSSLTLLLWLASCTLCSLPGGRLVGWVVVRLWLSPSERWGVIEGFSNREMTWQLILSEAHSAGCWGQTVGANQKQGHQWKAVWCPLHVRDDDGWDQGSEKWQISRCVLQRSCWWGGSEEIVKEQNKGAVKPSRDYRNNLGKKSWWLALARRISWLEHPPDTPRWQVWSLVGAHSRVHQWMHK